MDYLRDHKLLEGKKVIVNEEIEKMFGSSLEDIIEAGREDDEDEDGDKSKVRTEDSQVFKKTTKKELLDLFMGNLQNYHKIVNPDASEEKNRVKVAKGNFPKIKLTAEKFKNRYVTRISGLEPFEIELNDLSSYYANKFACSCTVHVISSGKKGKFRVQK